MNQVQGTYMFTPKGFKVYIFNPGDHKTDDKRSNVWVGSIPIEFQYTLIASYLVVCIHGASPQ